MARQLLLAAGLTLSACQSAPETTQGQDAQQKAGDASATPPPPAGAAPQSVTEEPAFEESEEEVIDDATRLESSKESKADKLGNRRQDRKPGEARKNEGRAGGGDDWDDDSDEAKKSKSKSSLASLESELDRLEGQMRMAGVPLPPVVALGGAATGKTSTATPAGKPLDCKRACELTEAICALADNICEMQTRHPGDERYANACQRATQDCKLGKTTCDSCSAD